MAIAPRRQCLPCTPQTVAIIIEALKDKATKFVDRVLLELQQIVISVKDDGDEADDGNWELLYAALSALLKVENCEIVTRFDSMWCL